MWGLVADVSYAYLLYSLCDYFDAPYTHKCMWFLFLAHRICTIVTASAD